MNNESRKIRMQQSCYILQFGTKAEKEEETLNLLRNKLITEECLSCRRFKGNYKGVYKNGNQVDYHAWCLGKGRNYSSCLIYEAMNQKE